MSIEEIETGIQKCYEKIFHTNGNIRDLVYLKDMQINTESEVCQRYPNFAKNCTAYDWRKSIRELEYPPSIARPRLKRKIKTLYIEIQTAMTRRLKKQLKETGYCDGQKIDTITLAGKVFKVRSTMLDIQAGWL
tara:strand:+ start:227 stop:628 length:402 start_codon:yes stop_codon:yes gene_type:complete